LRVNVITRLRPDVIVGGHRQGLRSDWAGLVVGQAAVAAFIALLVHGTLLVAGSFPFPRHLWGDEITYAEAARRISAGLPPNLELLWPPLYPRFLALALGLHLLAWLLGASVLRRLP
jgi:hypothetical protein